MTEPVRHQFRATVGFGGVWAGQGAVTSQKAWAAEDHRAISHGQEGSSAVTAAAGLWSGRGAAGPGPAPCRPRPRGTRHGGIIANGNLCCPTTPRHCWNSRPCPAPPPPGQAVEHDRETAETASYKLGK